MPEPIRPQKITFAAEKRAAATAPGFLQSGPNRNGPVKANTRDRHLLAAHWPTLLTVISA
jgi:hypothetical protein